MKNADPSRQSGPVDMGRAPFDVAIEGELAAILRGLGVGLAIASYQSSSVVVVSAEGNEISVLPRAFEKPMSVAADPAGRLAIATRNEVVVLAPSSALAAGYPRAPNRYAQLWLPRTVHFTGEVDLHDLAFSGGDLVGVATRLSCLARIDSFASVTPLWRPPFISDLVPEDRCHLNGVGLDAQGVPRFATALGTTDTPEGWREARVKGGVLLDIRDGRTVLAGLCMPHSPRLFGEDLYVLDSGKGEVLNVNTSSGAARIVATLPGYLRGFAVHGDLLFVGMSRLRDRNGAGKTPLPVEEVGDLCCGIAVLDRASGRTIATLRFTNGAAEVSDLALIPGQGRHGLLNHTDPSHRSALSLPDQGFWAALPR